MRFIVLNGSPKGGDSVTMQFVEWLAIKRPGHEFVVKDVCREVRKLEADGWAFDELVAEIASADAVIFAFPLYFLHVHANYKRFVELLFERRVAERLGGKPAASLSTSIHFYDHTAHEYVREVAGDLGMDYFAPFSAQMTDLNKSEVRGQLETWLDEFASFAASSRKNCGQSAHQAAPAFNYVPGPTGQSIDAASLKITVVADVGQDDANIAAMVDRFVSALNPPPRVVNLRELDVKGGCLGCIRCGHDNQCVYEGKDGFIPMFREAVMGADVLVFAGPVRDRFYSHRIKNFMDRSFFMTHQPKFDKAQVGFLVSGPLSDNRSMREVLSAYGELEGGNLLGFVSDEGCGSEALDTAIDRFAGTAVAFARRGYRPPKTFRYVGGAKLFRDEVFANLRFTFSADHRYYSRNGKYDFPTREIGKIALMNLLRFLAFLIPPFKRGYQKMITKGMLMPGKAVLKKARKKAKPV